MDSLSYLQTPNLGVRLTRLCGGDSLAYLNGNRLPATYSRLTYGTWKVPFIIITPVSRVALAPGTKKDAFLRLILYRKPREKIQKYAMTTNFQMLSRRKPALNFNSMPF